MEDIVVIQVTDGDGKSHYLMTWGRVFNAVDPEPLYTAITPHLSKWGIRNHIDINLCLSLQEASNQTYFYEGFFNFCQNQIPSGKDYAAWKEERRIQIRNGKEIYYLGINQGTRKIPEENSSI